jgi:hypothetical protein
VTTPVRRPPDRYLVFHDSRPATCWEAHDWGCCYGWCDKRDYTLDPIPLWDVPCIPLPYELVEVKPYDFPANLLAYCDYKFSKPEFVGKFPERELAPFPCLPSPNKES